MLAISFEQAESGKVKVTFADGVPRYGGRKGIIVKRKGAPKIPWSEEEAIVFDVRMDDGNVKRNVPGRHLVRK